MERDFGFVLHIIPLPAPPAPPPGVTRFFFLFLRKKLIGFHSFIFPSNIDYLRRVNFTTPGFGYKPVKGLRKGQVVKLMLPEKICNSSYFHTDARTYDTHKRFQQKNVHVPRQSNSRVVSSFYSIFSMYLVQQNNLHFMKSRKKS